MNIHFSGINSSKPAILPAPLRTNASSPQFACLDSGIGDTVQFGHGSPIVHPNKVKNARRGAWTRLKRAKKIPKSIPLDEWLQIGEPKELSAKDYQKWVKKGKPDQSIKHRSKRR